MVRAQMGRAQPANPAYRSLKFETIDPIRLQGEPIPERRWIVPGWIPHGQTTMLTGDGGVGKSLLAMQLLVSCATGKPWLGQLAMACKAVGIFCEDDKDELWRRQEAINRTYGVEFGDLENLLWVPRAGFDNALMSYERYETAGEPTELFQQAHDLTQDFGAQVLVLDALHDFFPGNENNRVHARQFVQLLTSLARDMDGAVLLCAHPSLSGLQSGSGTSGSTAWSNAVRSRLYLSRADEDEDRDRRLLTRKKANYAGAGDSIRLTWRDHVLIADEPAGGVVGSITRRRAETVFLDLLQRFEADDRPVSDASRAGNYAPRLFAKRPEREGFTKTDFERAMEALFAHDRIKLIEYGRAGDLRRRLTIVQPETDGGNDEG